MLPTPFLDLTNQENWIMAVAFHPNYAQNMKSVKGKILRFDVDSPHTNYIPVSNPYQQPNDKIPDEIIALGLHNPWKFSFDRRTGDF